jgi:DNA-binding CsgD family transcriptional regulator
MACSDIERLTPRQKECLRLLYARYEPKQIASELGISYDRVHQHFKAARERLGVQRSIEAARLLGEFEQLEPSHKIVSHENGLPAPAEIATIDAVISKGTLNGSYEVNGSSVEHVAHVPEGAPTPRVFLWPFPTTGRRSNDLNWWQRLLAGLLIAFVAIAIVGAMKALQT